MRPGAPLAGTGARLRTRLVPLVVAVLPVLVPARGAGAQSLRLQLESSELYAGFPFVLAIAAEGFDEAPAPEAPALDIEGARVTFLGVSPNVSTMLQIVNGQRFESRRVTFVYRYRIDAASPGRYRVPAVKLEQGQKSASSHGGSFEVRDIETTRDMRIRLNLPDRPIYVGETVPISLDWYLSRNVADQTLVVPLFEMTAEVVVEPAPEQGRRSFTIAAGARSLQLPFEQSSQALDGVSYTRFRFHALLTPNQPGALEVPPARVVARLEAGVGRDAFGFPVAQHRLFRTEDQTRRLSVRPLPQQGRPASFTNAIGTSFSIAVQASRTVVQVGDPLELTIQVRGKGRLEGVSLPPLDGEGGLDRRLFSVSGDRPPGEFDEEGKLKTYRATVRLASAEAREIPALPFSYFDPTTGEYHTVWSEPIALSVTGSVMVGAADVVGRAPAPEPPALTAGTPPVALMPGSLVGAELALSADPRTLRPGLSVRRIAPWLLVLYGVPIAVWLLRWWLARSHAERGRSSELRDHARTARQLLETARSRPAREVAPELIAALRGVARLAGGTGQSVLERLETEAYRPESVTTPFGEEILGEARRALEKWLLGDGGSRARPGGAPAAFLLGLLVAAGPLRAADPTPPGAVPEGEAQVGRPAPARGEVSAPDAEILGRARAIYMSAIADEDRVRRARAFGEAARLLRELAERHPDAPELLVDWGNAALGAQDLGSATLAYRRALSLDPGNERARKNLAWVRGRLPGWLPRPRTGGALDTLFFWHHRLSLAGRLLGAGCAFALMVLLLASWPGRLMARLRRLAWLALPCLLALLGSALVEARRPGAAVVVGEAAVLRTADSAGAPPALASPLPPGAEVQVLESRDGWTRVSLVDGASGWLRELSLARVAR